MSRGGRGGGRGGRRTGPDLSWEDADFEDTSNLHHEKQSTNVPGPLFPSRPIRTPKPLSENEKATAQSYLSFRSRCRRGPLFAVLDPSEKIDEKTGKTNKRLGFDPFNGQVRYSAKSSTSKTKNKASTNGTQETSKHDDILPAKVTRTVPDLSSETGRGTYGYTLRLYPTELWGILDPRQTNPDWKQVKEDSLAYASLSKRNGGIRQRGTGTGTTPATSRKRKRARLSFDDTRNPGITGGTDDDEEEHEDEDEDDVIDRRRKTKSGTTTASRRKKSSSDNKAKRGLEAEDDYPDIDQDETHNNNNDNDDEEGEGGAGAAHEYEEEELDSEFEESEDGQGDDYNAEQYFDGGDEDEFGAGGGDDGGGGGGDEGAY